MHFIIIITIVITGDCKYVLTSDDCGEPGYTSVFSVYVENVPCGTGQVTCTKAVSIQILDVNIYLVRGADPAITPRPPKQTKAAYRIIKSGIFLVINTRHGKVFSCQFISNLNQRKSELSSCES